MHYLIWALPRRRPNNRVFTYLFILCGALVEAQCFLTFDLGSRLQLKRTIVIDTATICRPSPFESSIPAESPSLSRFLENKNPFPFFRMSATLASKDIDVVLFEESNGSEGESRSENEAIRRTSPPKEILLHDSDNSASAAADIAKQANNKRSSSSVRSDNAKSTSVGARRSGSATKARHQPGRHSNLLNDLRNAARGASAISSDDDNHDSSASPRSAIMCNEDSNVESTTKTLSSAIQSAIGDMLNRNTDRQSMQQGCSISSQPPTVGILGDRLVGRSPALSAPLASSDDGTITRIATPLDDFDIASLRLSVFSDGFSVDQRSQFCSRSCQAIANRRKRGAVCMVAARKGADGGLRIYGTAECSFHEFHGTQLGQRRPRASILYVTEVAVHPAIRRRGIGALLLSSIDLFADRQKIETIYLHVDVSNHGAISLYEKCGYRKTENGPVFEEFTKSLNLHPGATKGRIHHLLFKDVALATWIPKDILSESPTVRSGRLDLRFQPDSLCGPRPEPVPAHSSPLSC